MTRHHRRLACRRPVARPLLATLAAALSLVVALGAGRVGAASGDSVPGHPAAGHPAAGTEVVSATDGAVHIRVTASRHGFGHEGEGFRFEVRQGQEVTLTFEYGDDDLERDNPHVFLVQGYGIRTERLDRNNPEVAVTFRADRAGTFTIRCIEPCTGHSNLLAGRLEVLAAAGATPEGGSELAVGLAAAATRRQPGGLTLVAAVVDPAGNPVPGVRVAFYEQASFLDQSGWAELGTAMTDPQGLARLDVTLYRPGELTFAARVAGRGPRTEARLTASAAGPVAGYQPEPRALGVPFINVRLIWLAAAGVWATYAMAAYQVYRVYREGKAWSSGA